jgi:hypothetical protein
MTIQRIETLTRMSKVVIHGDTVYLAGFSPEPASMLVVANAAPREIRVRRVKFM